MRMRHTPLEGEKYEAVKADLDAKMKRKEIIVKHGVSYQQLQKTFGFTHRKGPRKHNTEEVQVGTP